MAKFSADVDGDVAAVKPVTVDAGAHRRNQCHQRAPPTPYQIWGYGHIDGLEKQRQYMRSRDRYRNRYINREAETYVIRLSRSEYAVSCFNLVILVTSRVITAL